MFHVELFDLVSKTQNLAHNTQQVMEFQSGSLAVTISLTMKSCSWIKMGLKKFVREIVCPLLIFLESDSSPTPNSLSQSCL